MYKKFKNVNNETVGRVRKYKVFKNKKTLKNAVMLRDKKD